MKLITGTSKLIETDFDPVLSHTRSAASRCLQNKPILNLPFVVVKYPGMTVRGRRVGTSVAISFVWAPALSL